MIDSIFLSRWADILVSQDSRILSRDIRKYQLSRIIYLKYLYNQAAHHVIITVIKMSRRLYDIFPKN